MSEKERIKVVRKAITMLRKDKRNWPEPREKWALTYGFYGLLDYIEHGEFGMILDRTLRCAVQTVSKEETPE